MKTPTYYDLTAIVKWLFIIAVILFLFSSLTGCRVIPPSRASKVRCPTYPNYYHWVKDEHRKTMNPDLCPEYQDPRKRGFKSIGR